jgi:hypothetical protein
MEEWFTVNELAEYFGMAEASRSILKGILHTVRSGPEGLPSPFQAVSSSRRNVFPQAHAKISGVKSSAFSSGGCVSPCRLSKRQGWKGNRDAQLC